MAPRHRTRLEEIERIATPPAPGLVDHDDRCVRSTAQLPEPNLQARPNVADAGFSSASATPERRPENFILIVLRQSIARDPMSEPSRRTLQPATLRLAKIRISRTRRRPRNNWSRAKS
jgi:hypothetical protein